MTADRSPQRRGRRWLALLFLPASLCCFAGMLLAAAFVFNNWLAQPVSGDDLHQGLVDKVGEVEAVWVSLDDLWRRLAAGETVHCSEEPVTRPYFVDWRAADRARYPDLAALADRLNGVIRNVHRAADAWTAVCQGGEVLIPQETVDEARAVLNRAADDLAAVTQALQMGAGP